MCNKQNGQKLPNSKQIKVSLSLLAKCPQKLFENAGELRGRHGRDSYDGMGGGGKP